ncbi:U3 small nucleolar RNA-associated protein 11 [Lentithecium fluviatile CBS 122367]|uniref:U3 small nucleolar RNA-associated protein 11 n=1 Tax=Lentithecium fluviatile CBS 122367 TaxID=1168545 RepID=A0A6G1IHS8_9PLEO|nr:U3 small nucleolar RNA-associated protein 11 [Lentithecium fluviatile CBS 122367]
MSSMRNAVQRRNHKERAQPEERAKWGLLEKRKDYKLRAADHREKKKRLKILKEKAQDRNPDEFSFGMMSSKVDAQGRKVGDRGNKALSMDVVKLLKTQDAGYIRTMLQMVRKEREELEQKIVLADEEVKVLRDGDKGKKGRHTVYVGGVEEQNDFDEESWFGTGGEWPDRVWNRPRKATKSSEQPTEEDEEGVRPKKLSKKQQEAQEAVEREEKALMNKRARTQQRAAAHLAAVKARERDLMAAEEELEKQRAKMHNTVGGINKHGVKFKLRERKR